MTVTEMLTDLIVRGVEFQAHDEMLRFRSARPLSPADVDNIRRHKAPLLALLRAEGITYRNPAADPRPRAVCDRCGSVAHVDIPIHSGHSLRRDCGQCHRFLGWPRWYGQTLQGSDGDMEAQHED